MTGNITCGEKMITLIIPTMNRSDFLIRLLRYYAEMDFQGWICIGDSSNKEHLDRTKKVIESLQGKLNIIYEEYPELKAAECLNRLVSLVSTPYAALDADDDFLIPSALTKCVDFLERNPDYAATHGKGVILELGNDGAHGPVVNCEFYSQPILESESASKRLDDHMSNYRVTLLSVHKTESLQKMFQDLHSLKDNPFGELLSCSISVILGKSKELDCLYLVRQNHTQRYISSDIYDWITYPLWQPSYIVFRDTLAQFLALQDKISVPEAQDVVKSAFWKYLAFFINPKLGTENRLIFWKQVMNTLPGARNSWRFLTSFSGFSLSALLRSSSPYYADFIPVYNALTKTPGDLLDIHPDQD
ncbi:MAG: TIGR00180 family glycosyltransferase [Methanoregula sp.]